MGANCPCVTCAMARMKARRDARRPRDFMRVADVLEEYGVPDPGCRVCGGEWSMPVPGVFVCLGCGARLGVNEGAGR